MSVVEKIMEVTKFKTTDGQLHDTMDEAADHQEKVDFVDWCSENICRGGEWDADMVSRKILEHWRVEERHE